MEEKEEGQMVYVEEDVAHINRILTANNFYTILAIPQTATESQIKTAYKRISLLVHPDKNKAPGAEEAFKQLKTAAAVLLNDTDRKRYDELLRTDGNLKYTMCISDEQINSLIIATAIVSVGVGLFGLYKWLTSKSSNDTQRKRTN